VSRAESLAVGRAEAAVQIVHDAEELERLAIRGAAELLTPRLTIGSRVGLRLYPLPAAGPPEVLSWDYYDGMVTRSEPVARLVSVDASGAVYALARTRAARDFRSLLDDLESATVKVGGESGRARAEVVFE
jgi:hypothetical protein